MPNLNSSDWLIFLLYLFSVVAIGFSLRASIKTSKDFLQAGRSLPTWICALAFIAASLGSLEVIGLGAAGARYGFRAALFFSLGAIPALLFVGAFMIPLYLKSGARTVPEYLGLRFDQKTRSLNACIFAVMTLASAGISLYLMARLFEALHIFEPLFYAYGWPHEGIFTFCILLPAAVVLAYVLLAGLAGAMVNQVLQFLIIVAGFVPMVAIGLKNIGGWGGLKAAFPVADPHSASGLSAHTVIPLWLLLGFVLGAGRWCTGFRILQTAMAANSIESARKIPLLAAAVRLFIPFLLILPGAIAISLPTPQNTTIIRNENGAIFHEIKVVSPDAAQGRGLVPARLDAATGKPLLDSAGHVLLNYDRATPEMLMHVLPTGLLGLGLAALLACLMSGLAASFTAFNAVLTGDIYQSCIRKSGSDRHYLAVGRWATLGGTLLSIGAAYAISGFLSGACRGVGDCSNVGAFSSVLDALLLVISLAFAPQLATFLLGMFSKRVTGHGAFAGLAAGSLAALLHHGLTLPVDASVGFHGGWITVVHRYTGFIAQYFWTAILGFTVNLIVATAVSLITDARPEKELEGRVYSLTPKPASAVWWKRPETIAVIILIAATLLGAFFV
ncbi:MAG: Na+/galactose cotransporter [Terracidiphilus sp.]